MIVLAAAANGPIALAELFRARLFLENPALPGELGDRGCSGALAVRTRSVGGAGVTGPLFGLLGVPSAGEEAALGPAPSAGAVPAHLRARDRGPGFPWGYIAPAAVVSLVLPSAS